MEQQKEYYAFISYKREDEKWAKWLQDKLEHYRFPTNLNGRTDLPKNIRPTFRDVTDLNPGLLAEEINNALRNSQWLIVVCSPRSAKSPWVCKEAQTFIDLGWADHIIPFVIEGNPFSDDIATECYPEALRNLTGNQELLAANINEMGREAAAIKVVARMFNLRFDALWQRYEREKKHRRNIFTVAVAAFVLGILGIAGWIWQQNRELEAKNVLISNQNRTLDAKTDSLHFANDSIQAQQNALQIAYNDLARSRHDLAISNENLIAANHRIAEERDNVKKANYAMQVNLSRILAEKASALVDEGDSYLARLLVLEALPPNLPYTQEAEGALRKANSYSNAVLKGHTSYVYSACFSKDGNSILSASWDGTIRLWNSITGEECIDQRMKDIHKGNIRVAAFSPDEKMIVSASDDKTMKLWSTANHRCLKTLRGHTGWINNASFSPDGKHIISSDSETIVWDLEKYNEGDSVTVYPGVSGCFSPNGLYFATSKTNYSSKSVFVWSAINGNLVKELITESGSSNSISFSPDSKRIASTSKKGIIVWDVQKGDSLFEIPSKESISHIAFSPNGLYIASSVSDQTIKVWNAENRHLVRTFKGHNGRVDCVAFSSDSRRLVSSSDDRTIRIWDIFNSYIVQPPFQAHSVRKVLNSINAMAFSPNGRLMASATNEGIKLWNVSDKGCLSLCKSLNKYIKNVTDICFSHDGKILFSTSDSIIIVRNLYDNTIRTFCQHTKQVNSIALSHDGKFLMSCSDDKRVILWNLETGAAKPFAPYPGVISSVDLSPNGDLAISSYSLERKSGSGIIRIWRIVDGSTLFEENGYKGRFSPDGKYLAYVSAENHTIIIINISSRKIIAECKGHTDNIRYINFNNNGSNILSTSKDGLTKVWDVATGIELISFPNDTDGSLLGWGNVVINRPHDDEIIVTATINGKIQVLNFPSLQKLIDLENCKNRKLTPDEQRKYYLR